MDTRLPQLDGLRALAIAPVLWAHFWLYPDALPYVNRVAAYGWAGVDLFFALSGFLITRLLLARTTRGYFVTFYARRALRIVPLYYLLLLVLFVGLPLIAPLSERLAHDRLWYFLFLSNVTLAIGSWQMLAFDITWSLAVEEQFYLVWPAVVRWLSSQRLVVICCVIVVVTPLVRLAALDYVGGRWIHLFTVFRADALAVGALVALGAVPRFLAGLVLVTVVPTIAGLVLAGYLTAGSVSLAAVGYSLNALGAGAMVALAPGWRWLAGRPLTHVGKVSYGIYLWHPLVLLIVSITIDLAGFDFQRMTGAPVFDAIVAVVLPAAATIALATLSFYVYERPFLELKRHFRRDRHLVPATRTEAMDARETIARPAVLGAWRKG